MGAFGTMVGFICGAAAGYFVKEYVSSSKVGNELNNVRSELESTKRKFDESQDEISALKNQLARSENNAREFKKRLDEKSDSIADCADDLTLMKSKLDSANQHNIILQKENLELKSILQSKNMEIEELRSKIEK